MITLLIILLVIILLGGGYWGWNRSGTPPTNMNVGPSTSYYTPSYREGIDQPMPAPTTYNRFGAANILLAFLAVIIVLALLGHFALGYY